MARIAPRWCSAGITTSRSLRNNQVKPTSVADCIVVKSTPPEASCRHVWAQGRIMLMLSRYSNENRASGMPRSPSSVHHFLYIYQITMGTEHVGGRSLRKCMMDSLSKSIQCGQSSFGRVARATMLNSRLPSASSRYFRTPSSIASGLNISLDTSGMPRSMGPLQLPSSS